MVQRVEDGEGGGEPPPETQLHYGRSHASEAMADKEKVFAGSTIGDEWQKAAENRAKQLVRRTLCVASASPPAQPMYEIAERLAWLLAKRKLLPRRMRLQQS